MTKHWFIREEDGQPQDGEHFTDHNRLMQALAYSDAEVTVWEMDFEAGSLRDVTDTAAHQLKHNLSWGDTARMRSRSFLNAYDPQPITLEEHQGNLADAAWHGEVA